jgi:undecaprenyl-diphosphatase
VIAAALAVAWRRPRLLAGVVLADASAQLLSYALKQAIGRERPPELYAAPKALVRVPHDASFPSGHAASSFACATMLAFVVPRFAVPLYVLAAAIAFSRVYVGVHWPLDVLGGAALGVVIATALRLLARARRRSPQAPRSG